ncbi:PAQR family membrane homeostasis protein TrhA [Gulosibacter faecalis]|jgi:hemolysin III|uniref:Hemolysin III family protein n=1 Tax=Gulosibacter faecalis TaxID=272240 RepID=A0ABW5UY08_9MICO
MKTSDRRAATRPDSPATTGEAGTTSYLAVARPLLRGWLHTGAAPLALVLGTLLFPFVHSARGVAAVTVFTLCSIILFGMSALYHRFDWKPRTKALLRRFDHANIFLLIAGTYTPLALLALPPQKGWILLALVWTVAVIGIVFNVAWITAPRWLTTALYLATGWIAMMYIVDLVHASVGMMVLVLVGGLIYTAGAVVYALKRPNIWPNTFGFHEVFHAATVAAWVCHWAAILLIVLDPVTG